MPEATRGKRKNAQLRDEDEQKRSPQLHISISS